MPSPFHTLIAAAGLVSTLAGGAWAGPADCLYRGYSVHHEIPPRSDEPIRKNAWRGASCADLAVTITKRARVGTDVIMEIVVENVGSAPFRPRGGGQVMRFGRPGFTILERPIVGLYPGEWLSWQYTYNAAHLAEHFIAEIVRSRGGAGSRDCNPANDYAAFMAH